MSKLNQIIAIEKGIKSRTVSDVTELYKNAQKSGLFNGFTKTYRKINEDDESLPGEGQRVQHIARDMLNAAERSLTELMNVTARKDWTNCDAKGTIEVDGTVILKDVPVTFLLFLEKQVTDLRTFVATIPVLDASDDWNYDSATGLHKTNVVSTHRTKKQQKPLVLYPATPEHPAQTQIITEDVLAGFWDQVKQSGAMTRGDKQALAERVEKLLRAIKEAREAANIQEEVKSPDIGAAVFGYLLPK